MFSSAEIGVAKELTMAQCITCGTELHPERARKYGYCTAPACQEKNAKGLTMVAIGMNKAADELMILDDRTREELASGKYHDQRRGSSGTPARAPRGAWPGGGTARRPAAKRRPASAPAPARRQWTERQERLARLYNEQGLRPAEIASKLGVSTYLAAQIILAARKGTKN
jgi:hypothetical protein